MPVLAPIDRLTHQVYRAAVLHLKEGEHRRRFPPVLHVGYPGDTRTHVDDRRDTDQGLRCDIALALLGSRPSPATQPLHTWLTRSGPLTVQDCDLAWRHAVQWAAGVVGVSAHLVIVTRAGWFDPDTGVVRSWRRLRRHSPDPPWPS